MIKWLVGTFGFGEVQRAVTFAALFLDGRSCDSIIGRCCLSRLFRSLTTSQWRRHFGLH